MKLLPGLKGAYSGLNEADSTILQTSVPQMDQAYFFTGRKRSSQLCSHCGHRHNRDVNTTQNIMLEGLRLLAGA